MAAPAKRHPINLGGVGNAGLRNTTIWSTNSASSSWCWKKLIKLSAIMKPGLEFQVGNGHQFYVWLDIWHARGPLIQTFPRGPSITGIPADSLLQTVIQQGRWNWPSATDFDIQEIVAGLPQIHPTQPDSIKWKSRDGNYSTAAALRMLQPPTGIVPWRWLLGGKFKIPRHDFILWLAILERLSTLDRMWMVQQDMGCVLCGGSHLESHDHLFSNVNFLHSAFLS
ncbi:UNVERIFIED_CONTAM: hypothetical protein Sradi_6892700 [Sesamum radiatum]|uniref:Reverse transcriptase zinc-binding domain-containing protein n=1 Tax=Sesamum radiatum TaxID=300843 RepID=A0AAW2JIX3_SESRA